MSGTKPEVDLLDLIRQHTPNRQVEGVDVTIEGIRMVLAGRGLLIPTLEEVTSSVTQAPTVAAKQTVFPEISLSEEHRRQGLVLARCYAGRLGFTSDEAYMATLPEFPEMPSSYEGLGLTVPKLLETRLPWIVAAEFSGMSVSDYLREKEATGNVTVWEERVDLSKGPIAVWAQDGTRFVFRKPGDVRDELRNRTDYREYRAGTILSGIALWNLRPEMVKAMGWDIIGNSLGSGHVPFLGRWYGRAGLFAFDVGFASPGCRALVFGSKIGTLPLAA